MTATRGESSICVPNTLPRFCGQAFLERDDKGRALRCGQAYSDWMIDGWCGGEGAGRLIPLGMVPLWDPQLAAAEVRRNAARGCFAVTFSENPHPPGLPSVPANGRPWAPFLPACQETGTVLCMH